jgi:hypothetical protein
MDPTMKLSSLLPAFAVSILFPTLAAAQPSSADRATARELGQEGEDALAHKDYPTAVDRFGRAEALFHAPTLLLGLARAQVGLGKLVDAQESYRRIIGDPLPVNAPPPFVQAHHAARTELAEVAPRVAWITITVSGADGPTIKLDGQTLAPAALGVRRAIDPGTHAIVVEVQGTVVKQTTVTLGEGKSETVPLALGTPGSAPGPTPTLALPEASKPAGSEPPRGTSKAAPPPLQTLGFAAIGIGGAGLLVGVGTGAAVLAQHGSLASDCPNGRCPVQVVPRMNTYNALTKASTAGFVGGGVVAAAGVVLVAIARKRALSGPAPVGASAATSVGFSVLPTPGGGAFGVRGSFE